MADESKNTDEPVAAEARAVFDDDEVTALAERMKAGVEIRDRKYHLKTYKQCFLGTEAVEWLTSQDIVSSVEDALRVGNMLVSAGVVEHVTKGHKFKNEALFYRFATKRDHGHHAKTEDGDDVSWTDFLQPFRDTAPESMQPVVPGYGSKEAETGAAEAMEELKVWPLDEHNAKLLDNVHPAAWVDPTPAGTYNMVVIGAGAGGLVTAAGCAGVGARVAIIEQHLYGGDCLNIGCVPSKALLACAHAAHAARNSSKYGISCGEVKVDFGKVMERMRKLRAQIAPNDSCERFTELGVDVFVGHGKFTSKNTVEVNGQTLTFAKACVATGGRANLPPVPGLKEASYLTNATLYNLTELPKRLGVIGGGPIGMEMAQAFQRLGSQVIVFERSAQVLTREDPDAAAIVVESMKRDGVQFHNSVELLRVVQQPLEASAATEGDGAGAAAAPGAGEAAGAGAAGDGKTEERWGAGAAQPHGPITVVLRDADGVEKEVVVDELLVAAGRKPNVDVGLETAGIEYDSRRGVHVNDKLQTTNKNVYAVGDCCSPFQFTHVADFMARIVTRNALFFGRSKFSALIIPWVTYTEPEVAHVGMYERDLDARGIKYTTFTKSMEHIDRAILEGNNEGFVKVHVKQGSDEIVGATVVAANAGDIISELTLAMQSKTGLGVIGSVIHPYPTQADAVRLTAGMYNRTRLTPTVKTLFNRLMKLRR